MNRVEVNILIYCVNVYVLYHLFESVSNGRIHNLFSFNIGTIFFTWSWVFLVVGNVIVHPKHRHHHHHLMNFGNESTKNKSLHDNDVVVRNSMCVHDLVGVAHVRLVVGRW